MKNHLIILFAFAISLGILVSCKKKDKKKQKADNPISGNFSSQQTIKFDSTQIAVFIKKYPALDSLKAEIDTFYHGRAYFCAWFDDKGIIEQAENLYNHTQNIDSEGLPDKSVYKKEFMALMENPALDKSKKADIETELMLTAQYFIYAKNVWVGLDENETKATNWYLPRKKLSPSILLDSLLGGKDMLDSVPVYRQYGLLKKYLKKYQYLKNTGKLPVITPDQKTYQLADSSAVITDIRKWLYASGDLTTNTLSPIFDEVLATAVKNFQQRIGQKEDGIIKATEIKEMNVPLDTRIQKIIVNMERSRWLPVSLSNDYMVVNIPEYKLHVYEKNDLVWSMDVVVGQPTHKTVIFSGNIKYIVFSPYWNVPPGILKAEVLPGISRNRNYLAKHNMEWNKGNVRQKPGANNSLGLVKFLLPNSYDIYLHDTPAKSLFQESDRDFSHGCIRLAEPKKLATYLLRNDSTWTTQTIDNAMHAGVEKFVTIKGLHTLFITYFTAWVDRQGRLNFRKDIYKRDNRLAEMLLDKPVL